MHRPRLRRPGPRAARARRACSSSPAMAEANSTSCSMTCAPRVATRSVKSQRAARSRGSASPISRGQPARRASTAERMAPCRSITASYCPARSAVRKVLISWKVWRLKGLLRQFFGGGKMQMVNRAAEQDRWANCRPVLSSAASSARQPGSTTQSITQLGMCLPQRRHRRQRVQNVAHGA